MNERIRELAEQAFNEYESVYKSDANIPKEFTEKFAELIILECARYINERTQDWDADLRWIFNDGSGFMDVDVDDLLNKHFGVEE
jgi:hypothetical protein